MLAEAALLIAIVGAGPTGAGGKIPPEQLGQAKAFYEAGEEAMAAHDYATALSHFQKGYELAPHLHAFAFNIAAAAEAVNKCKLAKTNYKMFVDLVPKHPQRKQAMAKLKSLDKTCIEDEESSELMTAEAQAERKEDREATEASRAFNEALWQLRTGRLLAEAGTAAFSGERAFKAAARRRKRDARRMEKLLASQGMADDDRRPGRTELPQDARAACRAARDQQDRTIEALEAALELSEDRKPIRVLGRLLRRGDRDFTKFDRCST